MKKFIIICASIMLLAVFVSLISRPLQVFFHVARDVPVETFTSVSNKTILVDQGEGLKPFEIRGIDMGAGIPGHFATDYAIDKETYLRWFSQIQEMGANCVRVYTILSPDFYEAVWEYNNENEKPLYFIHGLWLDDYVHYSHRDAFDSDFIGKLIKDGQSLIDILHGNSSFYMGEDLGSGTYRRDISPWVLGYILGVEWEDTTVAFTNHMHSEKNSYKGNFMYTTDDSSPFEAVLAQLGDQMIEYETLRYKTQRLIAFTNWPTTDPFDWSEEVEMYFRKFEKVDVEHIASTDQYISGQFVSYHAYPYYPDYVGFMDALGMSITNRSEYVDSNGTFNSYRAYLEMLVDHHSMPVVISEYGVPSSRGRAQSDRNTNRAQGGMSEKEQAEALVSCYKDIMAAGCAGTVAFTWQDEWFKRTWNTMAYTDLTKTPYWSDYQTNEQYFGILSFDPGKEKSVCYVDGDISEWTSADSVLDREDMQLDCKYDEKYIYFRIHVDDYNPYTDVLYLPIDTTPKTGSTHWSDGKSTFSRPTDFLMIIEGRQKSRILVQERYEALRAIFAHRAYQEDAYINPPTKDTGKFVPIQMMLQIADDPREDMQNTGFDAGSTFETGNLIYGNGNPESLDFNSLADFIINGDDIEVRLPWSLLNFLNPSEMVIHDDYYEHYGIEPLSITEFSVGVSRDGESPEPIIMSPVALKGWERNPTYHERLKEGYYALQELWK